jgi:heme-degrading monooxygenase HmoA
MRCASGVDAFPHRRFTKEAESMFARVARYSYPSERYDEAVEAFRVATEQLRGIEGNTGGYLLVDRDNSTALTVTLWESRAAMEASEVRASRLRNEAIGTVGGSVEAVDRCEVAIDFSGSASEV